MRVPMSWLRELVTLPPNVTTAQVADALTRAGLQVERIERSGVEVSGPVVVGRVLEFTEQPQRNGKVIRWCQVDVGELAPRGVICGARNFESGDHVVVALPGAVLPGGFEITARKTYGRVSDGMICAEDELGLGTDHNGIMVLPEQVNGRPQVLGADAMEVLQARDEVLEIDVTPDIGYCLSMRGIARETAQAFGVAFTDPYLIGRVGPSEGGYPIRLESENCTVFVALTIEDVDPDAPTPTWMAARLVAAGMRSISLDVDITNYVMLESGQPLHAYDADRLQGPIVVRQAAPGERLTTLDDVVRKLSPDDLLITDDSGPIGLAGVMGGQTTELTPTTRNIVLEAARFDPVTIGRTFRRHKLPSEASARFSRGVDPALPLAAARMAARLMAELGTPFDGICCWSVVWHRPHRGRHDRSGQSPGLSGSGRELGPVARFCDGRGHPGRHWRLFCGPQAHHRFFGWCHAVAYSTPHRQAPGHWQFDVWRRLGCGRFLPWARHRVGGRWPAQGHRVRHCDGGWHGHF